MEKIIDKKGIVIRVGHTILYNNEVYQVMANNQNKSYFIYQDKRKTKKVLSRINKEEIEVINDTSDYALNIMSKNKINPYIAVGLDIVVSVNKKDEIIKFVCDKIGITLIELKSKSRIEHLVYARKIISFILFKKLLMSEREVCKEINVDRTNIYHYIKAFEDLKYDIKLKTYIIKVFDNEEKFLNIINS